MVIAALVAFVILLVAWILAPSEGAAQIEPIESQEPEPLAVAA